MKGVIADVRSSGMESISMDEMVFLSSVSGIDQLDRLADAVG